MEIVNVALSLCAIVGVGAAVWWFVERAKLVAARASLEARLEAERHRADEAERRHDRQNEELSRLDERLDEANADVIRLTEQIEGERRQHRMSMEDLRERERARLEQEKRTREEMERHFRESFEALAAKTLEESTEHFLKRAQHAFEQHREKADAGFDEKRKKIDEVVKPIREALEKTGERLGQIDKGRVEASAELKEHLRLLAEQTTGLSAETHKLVRSLKTSHVRGRWGELQLRRVVELAGMSAHCDFEEQATLAGEEGERSLRPDMLVRLPGERCIVVDAKASLKNYLESIEAETDEQRALKLKSHAKDVKARVDELAGKAYQTRLKNQGCSPDFTVLFVPGDQFLSSALLEAPELLEHAASKGVILTTPATLIALLKAVSFGWSQASMAEDAREILRLGAELHDRVATLTGHFEKLGQNLRRAVGSYNDTVNSMESRLLPGARRIGELGAVQTRKEIERQQQVLTEPKRVAPAESSGDAGGAADPGDADEPVLIDTDWGVRAGDPDEDDR